MINVDVNELKEGFKYYCNKPSKRAIAHDFFKSITTEIQAYMLGLIASDGCVRTMNYILCHKTSDVDANEIIAMYKIISPDARVDKIDGQISSKPVRGRYITNNSHSRIVIQSKEIVKSLNKLGLSDRKTYKNLHLPQIDTNLLKHFIRGYFDGDGSISYHVSPPNKKNREKNPRVRCNMSICSKTKTLLEEIRNFLQINDIKASICKASRDDMYILSVSAKKDLHKVYNLLYNNAGIYLSRKFDKFNHYVNTEVTQLIAEHRNAQKVNVNESNNPSKSAGHPTTEDENVC